MQRVWSDGLAEHVGRPVRVAGWFHHLRRLSRVSFLLVRDGRGLIQVVVDEPALADRLAALERESVMEVIGHAVAEPQAPGGVEIRDPQINVMVATGIEPPVVMSGPTLRASLPTILDHAPITLRHPSRRLVFAAAAALARGFRQALDARGFVEIQTPKLVAANAEGGANVFRVDYMGREAYLTQSPQLYKQIMVGVFERVYEVGPIFRAEPHDTPRHLNECVSLDAEVAFISDHREVMGLLRDVVAEMIDAAGSAGIPPVHVPSELPLIDFREALRIAGAAEDEPDLAPAHELAIGAWAAQEHGSDFVLVEGYPTHKRAFYTHPDPTAPDRSLGFDLIFRGWEVCSGAQRLNRVDDYLAVMRERGMNPAAFEGYLEAFRHGMPPHGGFAIGLERFTARLLGKSNLRDATLFPRDLNRLAP